MEEQVLAKICTHLEFMGYEVKSSEDYVAATHPTKPNMVLREFLGGVLHRSAWSSGDRAKSDRPGFLEYLNKLNEKAGVVRYFADEDSDVVIEAWYPSHYDRARYARFLEILEVDFKDFSRASQSNEYLA